MGTLGDLPIERVPIDKLKLDSRNARVHSPRNLDAIAASLRRFGQRKPIVVSKNLTIVAGNGTMEAARDILGWDELWVSRYPGSPREARAYAIADNHTAELAEWDVAELVAQLQEFDADLLAAVSFSEPDIADLLASIVEPPGATPTLTPDDHIPEPPKPTTKAGDVWLLGPHRLMCGDSTNVAHVAKLAEGTEPATLLHADPPYGMGKEAEGILNDNLYRENLDAFQMRWVAAWLPVLTDNASIYIWGTAPDLWRLWYCGGLADFDDLLLRNEIVWDKGSGMGMKDEGHHSFATITERCLFVMRGEQFLGNLNKEDFWEGYEPLRSWLSAECKKLGWAPRKVNELTNTYMAGHWLSRSQFTPIPENHYLTLQQAADGAAFTLSYDELFTEMFPDVRGSGNEHRRSLSAALRETRTTFDNVHDTMGDVWTFSRVTGAERYGHATPKPVAMVTRVVKTSSREGDWVAVPFGGSGPEFIAAEHEGRRVLGMEMSPQYVDIICRRYQEHTGVKPVRVSNGKAVDFTRAR